MSISLYRCLTYVVFTLQHFSNDASMQLNKYCLGHLFTYQKFVDPPGSMSHVYGLAYIGSPHYGSGICAGCSVSTS